MVLEDEERIEDINRRMDRFFNREDAQKPEEPEWLDIPLDAESQIQVRDATLKIEALAYRIGAIHAAHELKYGNIKPAL